MYGVTLNAEIDEEGVGRMCQANVLHYYAGGNTAKGFYDLFPSNLAGLQRIYILKGGPGTGKSHMMKKIAKVWGEKGYNLELIHCASDHQSLDGVIIRELKFGIVDGMEPHVIEPQAPGALEEYVNLGVAWDSTQLIKHRDDILRLQRDKKAAFQAAYKSFASGLAIHDDLEKIYINEMDFQKADELINRLIKQLFLQPKKSGEGIVRRRFLGATTPKGPNDFLPNITEGLSRRYFLKGRAGTGKSTALKKIAQTAKEYGFDLEIYHCGFDPESLDMVVVRELGWAVFDSTGPHEYFPEKDGDNIIDLYKHTVTPGTDEKYAPKIKEITKRYKTELKEGIGQLAHASKLHNQLEKIYIQAIDFHIVDRIYEQINEEIERLAAIVNNI